METSPANVHPQSVCELTVLRPLWVDMMCYRTSRRILYVQSTDHPNPSFGGVRPIASYQIHFYTSPILHSLYYINNMLLLLVVFSNIKATILVFFSIILSTLCYYYLLLVFFSNIKATILVFFCNIISTICYCYFVDPDKLTDLI